VVLAVSLSKSRRRADDALVGAPDPDDKFFSDSRAPGRGGQGHQCAASPGASGAALPGIARSGIIIPQRKMETTDYTDY